MNWITEAAAAAAILAGFITSITVIHRSVKKLLESFLEKQLESITKHIDRLEMTSAKSFIVMCLAKLEKGSNLSNLEQQRFWEAVAEYHRQHGNGYIDAKIDIFREQRKL